MLIETVLMEFTKGLQVTCSAELIKNINNYKDEYLYIGENITVEELNEDESSIFLTISILSTEDQIDVIIHELMSGEDVPTKKIRVQAVNS